MHTWPHRIQSRREEKSVDVQRDILEGVRGMGGLQRALVSDGDGLTKCMRTSSDSTDTLTLRAVQGGGNCGC